LGSESLLRGYPEDVVSGDRGWYTTAEVHTPIIPSFLTGTNNINITGQKNLPGTSGDTLEIFGFYDYGEVRASGFAPGQQGDYLESCGAGLNLRISQNLSVNFAYGFEIKKLPSSVSASLAKDKSRALISATLAW
jgi:hemolysin activation/secretion protein